MGQDPQHHLDGRREMKIRQEPVEEIRERP
jgi:hypothetical protein